nr:mRNA-capping enzyme-like isoform X1 [Ipomoea batatas]
MIASMDLNASPQPEDDDEIFGHQLEEESEEHYCTTDQHELTDYVESAVENFRRVGWTALDLVRKLVALFSSKVPPSEAFKLLHVPPGEKVDAAQNISELLDLNHLTIL